MELWQDYMHYRRAECNWAVALRLSSKHCIVTENTDLLKVWLMDHYDRTEIVFKTFFLSTLGILVSSLFSLPVHKVWRHIVVSLCKWDAAFPCQPGGDLEEAMEINNFPLQGGWLCRSGFSHVKGIKAIFLGPLKKDRYTNVGNQIFFKKEHHWELGRWEGSKRKGNRCEISSCFTIRGENTAVSCCPQRVHAKMSVVWVQWCKICLGAWQSK